MVGNSFNTQGCFPTKRLWRFSHGICTHRYKHERWMRDRLENIFLPFEVKIILNIPISYHLLEDSIIWMGNKKGLFSVKSLYYVARRILEKEDYGESSLGDVCSAMEEDVAFDYSREN